MGASGSTATLADDFPSRPSITTSALSFSTTVGLVAGDFQAKTFPRSSSSAIKMGVGPSLATGLISETSLILSFHSMTRWKLYFSSIKESDQMMVIYFTASWCRPCQHMEPVLKELAACYTQVVFVKIDVDELNAVAREWGVETMPTSVMVKKGKEVDRVAGAKKEELRSKIAKHSTG